jgi:hypothetical protein
MPAIVQKILSALAVALQGFFISHFFRLCRRYAADGSRIPDHIGRGDRSRAPYRQQRDPHRFL